LVFTLIPVLALFSHYDQGNCPINVGTEGAVFYLFRSAFLPRHFRPLVKGVHQK
jgi:hypothetical protein